MSSVIIMDGHMCSIYQFILYLMCVVFCGELV